VIEPVDPDAAAFAAVFTGLDQTAEPFTEHVARRLLIYPTDAYGLAPEQLAALVTATGDGDAYLSTVAPGNAGGEHYLLKPLHAYSDPALDATKLSPHAIYSTQGDWGVLATLEEEAYVGGTDELISALRLPRTPEQMAADWLAALAAVQHTYPERRLGVWARRQLTHLYGRETAERLTRDSPLASAP
jgi:hypothetical protein